MSKLSDQVAALERLEKASREAIILIDEINKLAESRLFYGIDQTLHAKLCTIRATIMRATIKVQRDADPA